MKIEKLAPKIIYPSVKKRRKAWPFGKFILRFEGLPSEDINADDWEIIESETAIEGA